MRETHTKRPFNKHKEAFVWASSWSRGSGFIFTLRKRESRAWFTHRIHLSFTLLNPPKTSQQASFLFPLPLPFPISLQILSFLLLLLLLLYFLFLSSSFHLISSCFFSSSSRDETWTGELCMVHLIMIDLAGKKNEKEREETSWFRRDNLDNELVTARFMFVFIPSFSLSLFLPLSSLMEQSFPSCSSSSLLLQQ